MRLAPLAILGPLGLAACDPYSPDLGDNPFRCGTSDPVCPSGYECVEYSESERICERPAGGGDPDGGGNPVECNDDSSIEPNDTINDAWPTPIPASMPSVSLVQLAICPASDRDLYRFGIDITGKNVRATVTTEVSDGELALQILRGEAVIGNGAVLDGTTIELSLGNLAQDLYYVRVQAGADGRTNNYALEIVTCGPGTPGMSCP